MKDCIGWSDLDRQKLKASCQRALGCKRHGSVVKFVCLPVCFPAAKCIIINLLPFNFKPVHNAFRVKPYCLTLYTFAFVLVMFTYPLYVMFPAGNWQPASDRAHACTALYQFIRIHFGASSYEWFKLCHRCRRGHRRDHSRWKSSFVALQWHCSRMLLWKLLWTKRGGRILCKWSQSKQIAPSVAAFPLLLQHGHTPVSSMAERWARTNLCVHLSYW